MIQIKHAFKHNTILNKSYVFAMERPATVKLTGTQIYSVYAIPNKSLLLHEYGSKFIQKYTMEHHYKKTQCFETA